LTTGAIGADIQVRRRTKLASIETCGAIGETVQFLIANETLSIVTGIWPALITSFAISSTGPADSSSKSSKKDISISYYTAC